MAGNETGQRLKARELNELIRYTMWSVFRVTDHGELAGGSGAEAKIRDAIAIEVGDLLSQAAGKGIVTRGCYDLQGMRADADYMFWWVAPSSDDLQEIYSRFRATRLGRASEPVWSVMALHRPAEFNKSHIPAFMAGEEPGKYVSVYPFVRSYDWYLLDDEERRAMLATRLITRHLAGHARQGTKSFYQAIIQVVRIPVDGLKSSRSIDVSNRRNSRAHDLEEPINAAQAIELADGAVRAPGLALTATTPRGYQATFDLSGGISSLSCYVQRILNLIQSMIVNGTIF
jgi:chlorite dismutase